jgi:3-oxoacyl-[acyl-carrier protein] reductase
MDMTNKHGRSFAGKVALVTGGSRGIGKGIVRRLASDGAAVAFTYSSSEEKAKRLASEIEAAGGNALPIKADNASAEEVRAAIDRVAKELGELDIFVNNAGILIREPSIATISKTSIICWPSMSAQHLLAYKRLRSI